MTTSNSLDPAEWARELREQVASAKDEGYFGPDSAMWHVNREAVCALGLGRALLLQISHPWVAQAIADHSTAPEQPVERLLATAKAAQLLMFGSRSQADATAHHIRTIHTHIVGTLDEDVGRWPAGTPYRANDPEALAWVLATLLDTSLTVYEGFFGPLSPEMARRFLDDGARLGAMVEVPPEMVPRDPASLRAWMDDMIASGTVAVGSHARSIHDHLTRAGSVGSRSFRIYSTLSRHIACLTVPEALTAQFGIRRPRVSPAHRIAQAISHRTLPRLPLRLRVDPITQEALRRTGMSI
ncbi:MAG TPA: oxygenase MpaB family protein [Chloroflexota bacterium]|nr:oxygenase MpaB family protein [Chloroflexota bacterium]